MSNSTLALDDGCGCDSGSNHSKRHFRRSTLQHPQLAMIPHASSVGWNCAKKNNAWQLWKLQCLADLSKEQSELRQQYQRKSLTISYSNNAYRRRLSLQCQQQRSPTTHVSSCLWGLGGTSWFLGSTDRPSTHSTCFGSMWRWCNQICNTRNTFCLTHSYRNRLEVIWMSQSPKAQTLYSSRRIVSTTGPSLQPDGLGFSRDSSACISACMHHRFAWNGNRLRMVTVTCAAACLVDREQFLQQWQACTTHLVPLMTLVPNLRTMMHDHTGAQVTRCVKLVFTETECFWCDGTPSQQLGNKMKGRGSSRCLSRSRMPWNHIPMAAAETMKRVIVILRKGCRVLQLAFPCLSSLPIPSQNRWVRRSGGRRTVVWVPGSQQPFLEIWETRLQTSNSWATKALQGQGTERCQTVSKCSKPTQHLLQRFPNEEKNWDHDQGSAPETKDTSIIDVDDVGRWTQSSQALNARGCLFTSPAPKQVEIVSDLNSQCWTEWWRWTCQSQEGKSNFVKMQNIQTQTNTNTNKSGSQCWDPSQCWESFVPTYTTEIGWNWYRDKSNKSIGWFLMSEGQPKLFSAH